MLLLLLAACPAASRYCWVNCLDEMRVLEPRDVDLTADRPLLRLERLEGDLLGDAESGGDDGAQDGIAEDLIDRGDP